MDLFLLKAKATECRLLAANSHGSVRRKCLALADDYDAIYDAIHQAVLHHQAQDIRVPVRRLPVSAPRAH